MSAPPAELTELPRLDEPPLGLTAVAVAHRVLDSVHGLGRDRRLIGDSHDLDLTDDREGGIDGALQLLDT
uniref:Uncharacterized protein n=1 Tax=Leviviridae sp. TaxID=2027243 RepID=A0A514D8H9_9VIRU|nr:MAG: hypothetical protein H4Rhizo43356e3383_000002 [Leviviridae sp.]